MLKQWVNENMIYKNCHGLLAVKTAGCWYDNDKLHMLSFILLPTDSILILITWKLCGKSCATFPSLKRPCTLKVALIAESFIEHRMFPFLFYACFLCLVSQGPPGGGGPPGTPIMPSPGGQSDLSLYFHTFSLNVLVSKAVCAYLLKDRRHKYNILLLSQAILTHCW